MSDEAKVGLVVVFALTVFLTTFLYVANVQLTGSATEYRTYFAYIGGLDEGSVVRFGGRKAGTVREVRPWQEDMTKTEVLFELRSDVPVNMESVATIASLNALGQNYLEVTPGSIEAARIEPGGTVRSGESISISDLTRKVAEVADGAVELMARIDDKMTVVADDMHAVLVNLEQLSGPENRRNVARLLENSNHLIESQTPKIDRVTTQLGDTLEEVERLAVDFREVADSANSTLQGFNRVVEETREPLVDSLVQLEKTLADADLLLEDARAMVHMNEIGVSDTIENFRRASEEVEALITELRQRPWMLFRTSPRPDRQVPATAAASPSGR